MVLHVGGSGLCSPSFCLCIGWDGHGSALVSGAKANRPFTCLGAKIRYGDWKAIHARQGLRGVIRLGWSW